MQNTSILLSGVALALAGAVATPSFAHTHHRHMAGSLHRQSTPAERQQTAQLNQQQLAQAQSTSASMNGGMATGTTAPSDGSMAVNNPGSTATETNAGSNTTGTATQQNGLTTEPTSYRRMHGSSGGSMNAAPSGANSSGTSTGTSDAGVGENQQIGSPAKGNMEGNPSGAVSPPPAANPSGTPQ